jgi:hypothetical protein
MQMEFVYMLFVFLILIFFNYTKKNAQGQEFFDIIQTLDYFKARTIQFIAERW